MDECRADDGHRVAAARSHRSRRRRRLYHDGLRTRERTTVSVTRSQAKRLAQQKKFDSRRQKFGGTSRSPRAALVRCRFGTVAVAGAAMHSPKPCVSSIGVRPDEVGLLLPPSAICRADSVAAALCVLPSSPIEGGGEVARRLPRWQPGGLALCALKPEARTIRNHVEGQRNTHGQIPKCTKIARPLGAGNLKNTLQRMRARHTHRQTGKHGVGRRVEAVLWRNVEGSCVKGPRISQRGVKVLSLTSPLLSGLLS